MNQNKQTKTNRHNNTMAIRICSIAMMICILTLRMTGFHAAAAPEPKKEETVSVKADANGKPYRVTVEASLSGYAKGKQIKDRSALKDIRNISGEETFTAGTNDTLTWESRGEEIRYKGEADAAELPVGIRITYYLDGRETVPEQMAGKSGKVRIRFEYENKTVGEDYVPFVFLTAVFLPEEVFTEIEVEHGSLTRMEDIRTVIGYGAPGLTDALRLDSHDRTSDIELPDYFEITARAENFSLEFSATVVTSGLLADRDLEQLEETKDSEEGLDELEEASRELTDAMKKLSDGAATFRTGLMQYTDGAASVAEGAAALDALLSQLDLSTYGEAGLQLKGLSARLVQGAQTLSENGKKLTDGYGQLHNGIREAAKGMRKFHEEGILELRKSLSPEALNEVTDALKSVRDADRAYDSFAGKPKDAKGSVRFLIETDAIKP